MELLFALFLVPLLVAGAVYVAVTTYRRYKDNQLESYDETKTEDNTDGEWEQLSGELLEKVEKAAEEIVDEAEKKGLLDRDLSKLVAVAPVTISQKFDSLKKDALLYVHRSEEFSRNDYNGYDPIGYVNAHNKAWDQLQEWLKDKKCMTSSGQVYHFTITKMDYPKEKPVVVTKVEYKEIPSAFDVFIKNHGLSETEVLNHFKRLQNEKDADTSPFAEQIRKKAVDKAKIEFLVQLKEIQKKVEDEQFLAKTTIEARDAEILRLKLEVEKLTPPVTNAPSVIGPRPRIPKLKTKRKLSVAKKNGSV